MQICARVSHELSYRTLVVWCYTLEMGAVVHIHPGLYRFPRKRTPQLFEHVSDYIIGFLIAHPCNPESWGSILTDLPLKLLRCSRSLWLRNGSTSNQLLKLDYVNTFLVCDPSYWLTYIVQPMVNKFVPQMVSHVLPSPLPQPFLVLRFWTSHLCRKPGPSWIREIGLTRNFQRLCDTFGEARVSKSLLNGRGFSNF